MHCGLVMKIKQKLYDGFDLYLDCLNNKKYFSFIKLNHFFWNFISGCELEKCMFEKWQADDTAYAVVAKIKNKLPENLFIGIGFGGCDKNVPENIGNIENLIKSILNSNIVWHNATTFKEAFLFGKYEKFINSIKKYKIKTIGLSHLEYFGYKNKIENHSHINLEIDSHIEKEIILENIIKSHTENSVYLFQAGETLSSWFILNLHNKINKCFLIDVGRALDYQLPVTTSDRDEFLYKKNFGGNLKDYLEYSPWKNKSNWYRANHIKII